MVYADSNVYLEISKECGAGVPLLCLAELAGNSVSSWTVVKAALIITKVINNTLDTVMLL